MGQCLARLTRRPQNQDPIRVADITDNVSETQLVGPLYIDPASPSVETESSLDVPSRAHTHQGASVEIENPSTKSEKPEKKDESKFFFEPDNENPAPEDTKRDLSKVENVPVECTDVHSTSALAIDSVRNRLRPDTYSTYSKYITEEHESSLPGFNVLDRTTFSVRGGNIAQSFIRKQAGYRIHVPPDCLSTPTKLRVAAALTGLFEFPENTTPVSATIHVLVEPKVNFEKPVTLELEHCCSIETEQDASLLSFAVADTTTGVFPYRFQLVDGGIFSRGNRYGTVSVPNFSLWTIVRSSISVAWNWLLARELPDCPEDSDDESSSNSNEETRNSNTNSYSSENGIEAVRKCVPEHAAMKYVAYIYYMAWRGKHFIWKVVLVIVQDLVLSSDALKKIMTKDDPYKEWDSFIVEFDEENVISLEGVKTVTVVNGWEIVPLHRPEIRSEAIKHLSLDGGDRNSLASCTVKLDFTWKGKDLPELLTYRIQLRGVQGPYDYFQLNFDPFHGLPQQLESEAKVFPRSSGMIVSGDQSSVTFDQLIKHVGIREDLLNRSCSVEHLPRMAEHLPDWLQYAEALRLPDQQIQGIKVDPNLNDVMRPKKVLKLWYERNGFNATYSGFIKVCLGQQNAALAETICRVLKDLL